MMLLYPLLTDLISNGEVGKATNTAVAELGRLLGGEVLLGIVLAGAMAAILSSAVGLLIQMTTTVAHDGYTVLLRPESSEEQRVFVGCFPLKVCMLGRLLSKGLPRGRRRADPSERATRGSPERFKRRSQFRRPAPAL